MHIFYIPKPGNPEKQKSLEILLDGIHRNFPAQITVTQSIKIETECIALVPMLEELSGATDGAEAILAGNGKNGMAICPWCHKEYKPSTRKGGKKSPYCSRSCAQQASAHERNKREFQEVGTPHLFDAPGLKEAMEKGEFATGTRFVNLKTKDEFYVNLEVDGDKVEYKLLPQPLEN